MRKVKTFSCLEADDFDKKDYIFFLLFLRAFFWYSLSPPIFHFAFQLYITISYKRGSINCAPQEYDAISMDYNRLFGC